FLPWVNCFSSAGFNSNFGLNKINKLITISSIQ
ncbi:MAG: hypothetical protein ACI88H_004046, partial [Cocleimonas sp.]